MSVKLYSKEFKDNAVKEILLGGKFGLKETSVKMGVPVSTLFGWKKKYANSFSMKKSKERSIKNWNSEEKLNAVIKTASLNENELGEYLRKNGLHSDDIENFKKDFISQSKNVGRPKVDQELATLRKDNKKVTRNLKRTQTALAEQSARIILLKKSQEIWGDSEDD